MGRAGADMAEISARCFIAAVCIASALIAMAGACWLLGMGLSLIAQSISFLK